jgi:uncharacterized membrane protein
MPLCARCTGIYSGLFFMTLTLLALRRLRRMRLPPVFAVVLGLGFFAAMTADVFTDLMGWRTTNNTFRLVTGALAGATIPALGLPLANAIIWEKGGEEARILDTREFLVFSGAVIILVLGARISNPFLFMAFSLLSTLGLVFFLFWMNALALSGLLGFIRKSWMALGLLLLSIGELAFLSMVHRWLLRMQGIW